MSYPLVKFGDVVRQVKDIIDPSTAGIKRYVAGEHMDTNDLHIRRWGEVNGDYLGPAFHMRFKPGQVLYGSRRTYLRKVALADFEGVCANTTFVLEPKNPSILLPELLPFIMSTEAFHAFSIGQSKGSVNPYVNFSDIATYEFALPPFDEQKQIFKLLVATEEEIESLKMVYLKLCEVEASVKLSIFSTNHNKVKLGDLMSERKVSYKTGPFGTVLKASSYETEGIPVVNPVNMGEGILITSEGPFISQTEANRLAEYKILENDIIFARKGDIGRAIFAKSDYEGFILGSDCIRVRVLNKAILSKYLFYYLTSPALKLLLSAQAHGTTMPGINEKMLSRMEVSIPPIDMQMDMIKDLDQIEKAKKQAQFKITRSEHLQRAMICSCLEHQ